MVVDTQQYTRADVAARNGQNDAPLWLIIKDAVYDVTAYMKEHPGGQEPFLEHAGKDASKDFDDVGHSYDARSVLTKYKIGDIVEKKTKTTQGPTKPTVLRVCATKIEGQRGPPPQATEPQDCPPKNTAGSRSNVLVKADGSSLDPTGPSPNITTGSATDRVGISPSTAMKLSYLRSVITASSNNPSATVNSNSASVNAAMDVTAETLQKINLTETSPGNQIKDTITPAIITPVDSSKRSLTVLFDGKSGSILKAPKSLPTEAAAVPISDSPQNLSPGKASSSKGTTIDTPLISKPSSPIESGKASAPSIDQAIPLVTSKKPPLPWSTKQHTPSSVNAFVKSVPVSKPKLHEPFKNDKPMVSSFKSKKK